MKVVATVEPPEDTVEGTTLRLDVCFFFLALALLCVEPTLSMTKPQVSKRKVASVVRMLANLILRTD